MNSRIRLKPWGDVWWLQHSNYNKLYRYVWLKNCATYCYRLNGRFTLYRRFRPSQEYVA